MGEKDKKLKEVQRIISPDEPWKKPVKIIKDEKQYRVNIPRKFADILKLDEGENYLEFNLIMDENAKEGFRLEAILVRE